jgi:Lon protease-like protein
VSESAATRELALFPLNTVLFPGGPLPLRIFETRYLDMVRACMREGRGFGVVLLERGPEAGGTAQFVEVGTEASIVDFTRLEDGLLGITCIGRGRFRVLEAWRQDDGLNVGRVADIEPDPTVAVPGEFEHLADALRRILPELGELYAPVPRRFEDAAWVGHRLAEMLPLATPDKQSLLEMSDPLARLAVIAPLIKRPD